MMSSTCQNILTISGGIEVIIAIEKACEDNTLLEYLNPIGEWEYEKAVEMWGTSREAYSIECSPPDLEEGDWWVHISFDTKDAPPITAYEAAMERLGVGLSASYYNDTHIFVGLFDKWRNDINAKDKRYDIDYDDDWWFADIPSDLRWEYDLDGEYEYYRECKREELM
jgi:hypothetical protein